MKKFTSVCMCYTMVMARKLIIFVKRVSKLFKKFNLIFGKNPIVFLSAF